MRDALVVITPEGVDEPLTMTLYYVAYQYDTEEEAKRVWEQANRIAKGVSCWRMHAPRERPHTDFFVIGMGEEPKNALALDDVLNQGSAVEMDLEPDLVQSLASRRIGQAIESLKRADPELKQVSRTPQGRVLRPDGSMVDYNPEEEQ